MSTPSDSISAGSVGIVAPKLFRFDAARGITQFVVGTGGNVLAEQWQTQDSRSAFRKNTYWGALKLTLRPGYAQYAFYSPQKNTTGEPIGNDPTVPLDMGTVPCH